MTDPFPWSLNLGRWGATQVRVHLLFLLFAGFELLGAAVDSPPHLPRTAAWLGLLLVALALHELGHALMAARLGLEHDEVRLWPLGNLIAPGPRAYAHGTESAMVAAAGPAVNLLIALVTAIALGLIGVQQVFNPFGYETGGAPFDPRGNPAAAFSFVWFVGWFGYLNWVLFLANLIPAPPLDGGRFLRGMLAGPWGGHAKESLIGPYTAHVCAAILGLAGLFRLLSAGKGGSGLTLIGLAILIEIMVRNEARLMEEGGFFDEGLFGYDFSQGYTSLEAGNQKVRPYRESALRRWRRRRSDLRRQRREAREAAEEQRMDEILAKLSREGRSALTDEEQRFLVRVSVRYRNRPRARD